MSLSTTPTMAVGWALASSMVRMPPREVPMNTAGGTSSAVSTARRSASSVARAVVARVAVVIGEAAAAVVDREHAPRRLGVGRERRGQIVEIGSGAGQAWQAHHRQAGRKPRAVAPHVELEAIGGGDENAARLDACGAAVRHELSVPAADRRRSFCTRNDAAEAIAIYGAPLTWQGSMVRLSWLRRRGAGRPRSAGGSCRRSGRDRPGRSP